MIAPQPAAEVGFYHCASKASRAPSLTQPEVEIVLQLPRALFDCVQDEVGVAGVKTPVQVLWDGHQFEVLHPPHLEARILPSPLELGVLCHPVGRENVTA